MSTLSIVIAERDEALEEVRQLKEVLAELMGQGFDCAGEDGHFTKSERCVLSILKAAEGRIVQRKSIMSAMYTLRPDGERTGEKIIDVLISRIRRKLRRHSIETVWGVGWRLVQNEGVAAA